MSDLPKRLRIKAGMIALGEQIAWGSDTALMEEAADVIEALSASVENHQLHMLGMARDRDQLRALLAAQPQAIAAQSAPDEREAFEAAYAKSQGIAEKAYPLWFERHGDGYTSSSVNASWWGWQQHGAWQRAQSAPAGEREAEAAAIAEEIDWLIRQWDAKASWSGERMAELLEAAGKASEMLASWQRKQSGGVPEGWRGLLDRIVPRIDAGGPNPIDPEIHHCEWALYQERERIHAEFESMLAAAPAQPAAQDQGEVQRLREALEEVRSVIDAREMPSELSLAALSNMIDASLAANTGQEV